MAGVSKGIGRQARRRFFGVRSMGWDGILGDLAGIAACRFGKPSPMQPSCVTCGRGLASVILDLCRPQAREPMPVNLALPHQKFVDRDIIALAGLAKAKKPTAHRGDDLRLSPDNPALYIRRGKVRNCQRTSIRPRDVTQTGRRRFWHSTLTRDKTSPHCNRCCLTSA
jgi:hypothetical protein